MSQIELFHRYPSLHLPFVPLSEIPTPLENLKDLGEPLGIDLWIKRDDLSGSLYGGNKLRKLEFLLADALEKGLKNVWTVGAIGSHHVLATCIWARHLGLEPSALHFPQPLTSHVQKNLKALATTRPNLTLIDHRTDLPVEMFKVKLREWLKTGEDFYYIPGGGSSALGAIGYVNAALELVAQFEAKKEAPPDVIYVAAGTCGTLVGLTLGLRLAGAKTEVVGVRVVDKVVCNRPVAARLGHQMSELLYSAGLRDVPRLANRDYIVNGEYFGGAYGVPTAGGEAAIVMAQEHGLKVEATYTGKAFAALVDQAPQHQGKRILYWHTLNGADLGPLIQNYRPEMLPDAYKEYLPV